MLRSVAALDIARWREVADRVYVRRHPSLDLNVGLVVGDGACVVVDTRASETEGRELAEAIRQVTPDPWVVVNTHMHYDHTFGNAVFRPAAIWGHRRCAEILATSGAAMRERVARHCRLQGLPEAADEVAASRIDPPDELVDDIATMTVGGRPVHVRHLGRGHTDNDVVVLVPDADLVLAGDLVEEGAPPQFADGFPLDWPGTLDALLPLITGPVVPGHGAVVDRRYVQMQRDQLARVAEVARAANAEGRPVADAALDLPDLGEYAVDAIERAYLQLSSQPPGRHRRGVR
jgi:glyoxylase-like metal-dependent hydrolase (beta-lactamase superfamily II)